MKKFQGNLSRPGIIDARARYRASARQLRNTALNYSTQNPSKAVRIMERRKEQEKK